MPLTFQLDPDRHLVTCTGRGVLTGDELAGLITALRARHDFDPGFRQLWDLGDVTAIPIPFQDMLWLADADLFAAASPRAFYAPADAVFGMARMFVMMREAKGETGTKVFRDRGAAMAWLAGAEGAQPTDRRRECVGVKQA